MVKEIVRQAIREAIEAVRASGELSFEEMPEFSVERPPKEDLGDFATNAPMILARPAKRNPRDIAALMIENLRLPNNLLGKAEVAGGGFINVHLNPDWLWAAIREAHECDQDYGRSDIGGGARVQVEFVSANPTGPLHVGNARGGVIGDVIANLLEFIGFDVEREYYVNDVTESTQVQRFGESLEARYMQLHGHDVPIPEDGYKGAYVSDIAQELVEESGKHYVNMKSEKRAEAFAKFARERILERHKKALVEFGIKFDNWVAEQWLYDSGRVAGLIERLTESGFTYEAEGALWLSTTKFGDYKDEVLVRRTGVPTYYASDIAYHLYKVERGYKFAIDVWGADHHGHIMRTKTVLSALGVDSDWLNVILYQFVRLYRGGEVVAMGKREGEFVTLEDLLEWVPKDAARYFLLMRSADTHLDFDVDLAVQQTSDNPVYYIQYVHARCRAIFRQAMEQEHLGLEMVRVERAAVDLSLLTHVAERRLMREIAECADEVQTAAAMRAPHRLTTYSHRLADAFHRFYTDCRVLEDDAALSAARLVLVEAAQITVRNVLALMGVSAPEQM